MPSGAGFEANSCSYSFYILNLTQILEIISIAMCGTFYIINQSFYLDISLALLNYLIYVYLLILFGLSGNVQVTVYNKLPKKCF